jgi:outer membrane protein
MKQAVLIAAVLCAASPALAQDGADGWSAGLIGAYGTSPYIGQDDGAGIAASLQYRAGRFTIGTGGLSYSIIDDGSRRLDALLLPRFTALDAPGGVLAGIDRDVTADIGLRYAVTQPGGTVLGGTFRQEITGEHDGQEIDLRASQRLGGDGPPITAYAGATWRSGGLSEYLYGVLPGEAAVGRPAYDPGATLTPYLGVSAAFPLNDRWSLVGGVRVDMLGDAITDSPIVDDGTVYSANFGVNLQF